MIIMKAIVVCQEDRRLRSLAARIKTRILAGVTHAGLMGLQLLEIIDVVP